MNNMDNKKYRKAAIFIYVASACLYISVIINIICKNTMEALYHFGLASLFLCMGSVFLNKGKDSDKK